MNDNPRTVAVVGAGVIGQIYAGRLAESGCDVWLLARGSTHARLQAGGIQLSEAGVDAHPSVKIVDTVADIPPVDMAFLAVRADQVTAALPLVAEVRTPVVVTLVNLTDDVHTVATRIGMDRVIIGFPGVGGTPTKTGIEYRRVKQQPTMLGTAKGREQAVARVLRSAGFDVEVAADMEAWLATHTVFIAGAGAAILSAHGAERLGMDRAATTQMVLSIRDGFTHLARNGIRVTPPALRSIFTWVPRLFSVAYWQRQMRGELGMLTLAPHVLATRDTEFPLIAAAARRLAPGARHLSAALDMAGYPEEDDTTMSHQASSEE